MSVAPNLVGLVGHLPPSLTREWPEFGAGLLHLPHGTADGQTDGGEWSRLCAPDVVFLAAKVTATRIGGVDIAPLTAAAETVGRHLRAGQLVIVTGPVPPGTTRRAVQPALAKYGPPGGVAVAYTPDLLADPRVVGGVDEAAVVAATAAFARLGRVVRPVSSTEAAEACGTAAAVVRTAHAALATELHRAWERMGVDGREVVDAAGISDLHPYHPVNETALLFAWGSRRYRASTRLLDTAIEVNGAVAEALAVRVADALNRLGRPVRRSRVVVVCATGEGAAEPAAGVVRWLIDRGAAVRVHTPPAPLTAENLASEHGVLLLTDPPPGWDAPHQVVVVDAR